ncbi:MAG: hypothetical protein AAGA56_07055 [Myxococcota bacterium]
MSQPEVVLYQPREVAIAACVAASVLVWSALLLALSTFGKDMDVLAIAPSDEVSVRVKPVLDLESPKLKGKGGEKLRGKLPSMWTKEPPPRPSPRRAKKAPDPAPKAPEVSTKAKDRPDAIPDSSDKPVEAAPADSTEAPDQATPDTSASAVGSGEPPGGGGEEGEPNDVAGTGDGGEVGRPHGTVEDPLKSRALGRYRGRVAGFFRTGFSCAGITDELKSCVPSASFRIAGDGTVTSMSFNPCGNPARDGPAKAAAQSKVGAQVPPPPEKYPEFRQPGHTISYACR